MNAYTILKFVHVLSVVIWIGGLAALAVATWRIAREQNRVAIAGIVRQAVSYGQVVVGPAAVLVLLTGLAMVGIGHVGFGTFWVWFGYGGVLVHGLIGGFLIRKRAAEVTQLASAAGGDDAALLAAARRLWNAQLVYLILFAVVIAAMVFKPTL
ncbi:MAG TPA: DUF2269 family protein [Gemmatimonadaceae bacterium]|nr:DUF2269 family protein [Gemmatimonadaceae bacterium]